MSEQAEDVESMDSLPSDQIPEEKFKFRLAQGSTEILYGQLLGASDMLNICVIKIINNLLHIRIIIIMEYIEFY